MNGNELHLIMIFQHRQVAGADAAAQAEAAVAAPLGVAAAPHLVDLPEEQRPVPLLPLRHRHRHQHRPLRPQGILLQRLRKPRRVRAQPFLHAEQSKWQVCFLRLLID